jgi:hypothetical protein
VEIQKIKTDDAIQFHLKYPFETDSKGRKDRGGAILALGIAVEQVKPIIVFPNPIGNLDGGNLGYKLPIKVKPIL